MFSSHNDISHSHNSFDLLRVLAALAVLYSHSYALFGLPEPEPIAGQTYGSLAVALFFAVSGFLVCQSWSRDPSAKRFTVRRSLRILPGLFFVVVFTALVVGPIFTSLSAKEYLSRREVWIYIGKASTMLGEPHLPGLFEDNVYPRANNGSLWTLKYEVLMYMWLAFIGWLCPKNQLKLACVFSLFLCATSWIILTIKHSTPYQIAFESGIGIDFFADRAFYLGVFFFAGSCLHLYFSRLHLSVLLATLFLILCLVVTSKSLAMILLWIAIPYASIVFAFRAPEIMRKFSGLDYSYGIYIFGFPIQQIISQTAVAAHWSWASFWWVSVLFTVLFAAFSWHFIERPALSMKRRLM